MCDKLGKFEAILCKFLRLALLGYDWYLMHFILIPILVCIKVLICVAPQNTYLFSERFDPWINPAQAIQNISSIRAAGLRLQAIGYLKLPN